MKSTQNGLLPNQPLKYCKLKNSGKKKKSCKESSTHNLGMKTLRGSEVLEGFDKGSGSPPSQE